MRVHHLNTGTLCPVGQRLVNGTGSPFRRARMICHVLLVELPSGLALIDGGIGLGDIADPDRLGRRWVRLASPRLDRAETAVEQVRALGFAPEDVRHIVLTHLDLDHAGCVPDFPSATVHVHARELAAVRAETRRARWRYIPAQQPSGSQVRSYADGGDTWRGFTGVRALDDKAPDVLLVPLAGHTPGHTGVAVRSDHGWLFHAGDAYFFHGQIAEQPRIPLALRYFQRRADTDRAARVRNQARVRELALGHADVQVFCAHDPVEYDRAVARAGAARARAASGRGPRRRSDVARPGGGALSESIAPDGGAPSESTAPDGARRASRPRPGGGAPSESIAPDGARARVSCRPCGGPGAP